jgi:hypothetical protein
MRGECREMRASCSPQDQHTLSRRVSPTVCAYSLFPGKQPDSGQFLPSFAYKLVWTALAEGVGLEMLASVRSSIKRVTGLRSFLRRNK